MMRLAEAFVRETVAACLVEPRLANHAHGVLHFDNLGLSREDDEWQRRYALEQQLPPNPDEDVGGSVVTAMLDKANEEMRHRTGLDESEPVA